MYTNVAWYLSENDTIIFRVFILSCSLEMRGVDGFLRTDLESEWMINLEDL